MLFDIRDRERVMTPQEIEAGRQHCEANGLQYIEGPDGRAIPLATYVERLTKRWHRAVQTGRIIDAIRAGYGTIEPAGSPAPSLARH